MTSQATVGEVHGPRKRHCRMVHGEGMNVFLDFQACQTIEVAQENSQDALIFFFTGILPKDQHMSTIAYETRGEEILGGTLTQHFPFLNW